MEEEMRNLKSVSIVIPAKNEEETIDLVLNDLNKTVADLKSYSFEIIVVDDNSSDRTAEIAIKNGARVIRNKGSSGKGKALICGFNEAKGEFIVMMDADYSHRAEDIPFLIQPLENGAGLVIGSRIYGGSDEYTRVRAFGNIILTLCFGLLHKRYLSDALNGFKAFRRDIFRKFTYTSREFEIEIELLVNTLRAGMKIVEVSSHERRRKAGIAKSKVIKHGFKFFYRIVIEWLRNKFNRDRYVKIT